MKWGVTCGSNERKEGLIMVSQGVFYEVLNVQTDSPLYLEKLSWQNHLQVLYSEGCNRSDARCRHTPMLQLFDVLITQTTCRLPARFYLCPREAEISMSHSLCMYACHCLLAHMSMIAHMGGVKGCRGKPWWGVFAWNPRLNAASLLEFPAI